jgi:calcium channel MID1
VQIPRCEDFSSPLPYLQARNIAQNFINGTAPTTNASAAMLKQAAYKQSRNPLIDREIEPGPYMELLPCEDLCFSIVRSCPANLGFSCPNGNEMKVGYGQKDVTLQNMTCSYLGAVLQEKSGAGRIVESWGVIVLAVVVMMLVG